MGKYKKQIGTFAEFCKAKKRQYVKENNEVAIEVPFWDDAIQYALDNLRFLGGGGDTIGWNRMVERIKIKFNLLNIFDKGIFTDEGFVLAHVKDILYHQYGAEGFLSGGVDNADNYDSEELGAKAFVMSKLADTVLQKAKEEAGIIETPEPEETKTVARASLDTGWEDDYLPFETHQVSGFDQFSKLLKEGVDRISCQDDGQALDYVLDQIRKKAGSLKLEDIQKVLDREKTTLERFAASISKDYLSKVKIELNGTELNDRDDKKNVIKIARKLFAYQIAKDAMQQINKENKEGK